MEFQDRGEVFEQDDGSLWQFERTFPSGGDLSIDGTRNGVWYLSGESVGDWTLGVSYGIYLVSRSEGSLPYSYGLVSVSETELVLHDDVGTGSDRLSTYRAQ